jgi:hypothetical protein
MQVYVNAPGDTAFQSIGSAKNRVDMRPYPVIEDVVGASALGSVKVEIT